MVNRLPRWLVFKIYPEIGVIIDCDLQDPPELIYEMNLKMNEGFDAVLARRKSRKGETLFKKIVKKLVI